MSAGSGGAGDRRRVFGALAGVFVVLAITALAEFALQLREYRERSTAHTARAHSDSGFVVHPFLQVAPRPNPAPEIRVNRHGFRGDPIDAERDAASAKTLRVFALGGSTSYSGDIVYEATWPARLEALLERELPGVDVVVQNASCDWYSSAHSLVRYLGSVRRFDPDVVLVFHGINDLYRGFAPEWFSRGGFAPDYGHYLGPLVRADPERDLANWFPFRESLLLRALRRNEEFDPARFDPFRAGAMWKLRNQVEPTRVETFPSLPVFAENLRLLARAVRADGADFALGTQPHVYGPGLDQATRDELFFARFFAAQDGRYPDFESMERGMTAFNDATRSVARELSIPLADLARAVPRDLRPLHRRRAHDPARARTRRAGVRAHAGRGRLRLALIRRRRAPERQREAAPHHQQPAAGSTGSQARRTRRG